MKRGFRPFRRYAAAPALALLGLGLYEFFSRIDAMAGPLNMFIRMAVGEHIPLNRVMLYVDFSIFAIPAYALLCAVYALACLLRRTKRSAHPVLLLFGILLCLWSWALRLSLFGLPLQLLKLLPLLLITALCAWDLLAVRLARSPRRKAPHRRGEPPETSEPPRHAAGKQ